MPHLTFFEQMFVIEILKITINVLIIRKFAREQRRVERITKVNLI